MQNEQGRRWTFMFSLARVSLLIVALAAALGWAASFVGLHDYGVRQLYGFTDVTAWFIPGAIDGAAFATSLMTYRANIKGRAAIRGRLLMWAFTAASGWINWIHQLSPEARFVAAGLPVAAVAVFDIVLIELRADFEERHGRRAFRLRPGLLMLRYAVDKRGTSDAFRRQIEAIPVASLAGLGNDLITDAARRGRIVPRQWIDLPQAKNAPLAALTAPETTIDGPDPGMTVPGQWLALPQATSATWQEWEAGTQDWDEASSPAPTSAQEHREDAESQSTWEQDASEQPQQHPEFEVATSHVPDPRWEHKQQDARRLAATDSETTTKLPVISNEQRADERAAARELVRQNPDEWTGKSLGDKFGKSSSWGRTQIKAARQELEETARQRPQLVAVDS